MSETRLSIPQYAMALAHVASLRSEDPYRKVGAAALDFDNRVIGTAYNGLAPGYDPRSGILGRPGSPPEIHAPRGNQSLLPFQTW